MSIGIPRKIGHIWIGPLTPPTEYLETWKHKHPDWEYTLYDNNFLNTFNFKTKKYIDFYMRLGWYPGAADLMRLEILYNFGGFLPEADSICYRNTDELFPRACAYTVYENEFVRGKLVSPILASNPNNDFVGKLINEILKLDISDLDVPWRSTGNLFVAKMIDHYNPDIVIFPSHYFIPVHFDGIVYRGNDKIYAKQMFGSTHHNYFDKNQNLIQNIIYKINKRIRSLNGRQERINVCAKGARKRFKLFDTDFS